VNLAQGMWRKAFGTVTLARSTHPQGGLRPVSRITFAVGIAVGIDGRAAILSPKPASKPASKPVQMPVSGVAKPLLHRIPCFFGDKIVTGMQQVATTCSKVTRESLKRLKSQQLPQVSA
jgi:hypothetical protein